MVNLTVGSLCNISDVRRIAGINALQDISDGEIGSYIDDSTKEIYGDYGNPINVTYVMIESGTGSTLYDFTGNYEPVYNINRMTIGGDFNQEVPTGSVTNYLDNGFVDINLTYLESKNGKSIKFEYIPITYHLLAAYKSAADLLATSIITSDEDAEFGKLVRIKGKITKLMDDLKPKGAFNASTISNQDIRTQGYKFISQKHWSDLY